MIPQFNEEGLLPLGIYDTSLEEIGSSLGGTQRREQLIAGLQSYMRIWNASECLLDAYIDGSFVTETPDPCDVDIILVPKPESLYSYEYKRHMILYAYNNSFNKSEFGCEAFIAATPSQLNQWVEFFSYDKLGRPKGLLRIRFPL